MTLASAGMMAQSVKIAGTLRGSVPADLKLYVMPVGVSSLQPDSVSVNGQKILANTPVSPYNITMSVWFAASSYGWMARQCRLRL